MQIENTCRSENRGVHKYTVLLFDKEKKNIFHEDHMHTQHSEITRKPQKHLKQLHK